MPNRFIGETADLLLRQRVIVGPNRYYEIIDCSEDEFDHYRVLAPDSKMWFVLLWTLYSQRPKHLLLPVSCDEIRDTYLVQNIVEMMKKQLGTNTLDLQEQRLFKLKCLGTFFTNDILMIAPMNPIQMTDYQPETILIEHPRVSRLRKAYTLDYTVQNRRTMLLNTLKVTSPLPYPLIRKVGQLRKEVQLGWMFVGLLSILYEGMPVVFTTHNAIDSDAVQRDLQ